MSWLTLQVAALLLSSASSVLDKHLVHEHEPSPVVYLASFAIVGFPVAAIGLWLTPWRSIHVAGIGLLTGLIFSVIVVLYYRAMRLEDVSRLIPILRLSDVLKLMMLAVFLNDRLALSQYVAAALMIVGAICLAWKRDRSGGKGLHFSQGMALMFGVACLQAFDGVLESHIDLTYSPWELVVLANTGTVLGTGLMLLSRIRRAELQRVISTGSTRFRILIIGEQIGRLTIGLLSDFAIKEARSAALVSAIGGFRPLLIVVLAALLLGERVNRQEAVPKLAGVGLMGISTGLLLLG